MCLCMIIVLMPVSVKAAAEDISVYDPTYYTDNNNNVALKSVETKFDWSTGSATSRLVLMTNKLRSAGEEGTNAGYGDFTNLGFYGDDFSSFEDVKNYDTSNSVFGIVSYTDETNVEWDSENNTITFNFKDTDIPLNVDKTYYVYLWTYWGSHYYPDNLFCVIRVQDGVVEYTTATEQNAYVENDFKEVVEAYDVTITPTANMTKTNESGAETQNDLTTDMKPVIYTADDGYYFPENYAVATVNGIMVRRDSETQITVYGTPSNNAAITLAAPTETLEHITFDYAYDVQRSPAFPTTAGTSVKLSGLYYPLNTDGSFYTTNAGSWTLTKAGTYSYVKSMGKDSTNLKYVVESIATNYSLEVEGVILHELKDGDNHIAYGVVVAYDEANKQVVFLGDNHGTGAGYLLSETAITTDPINITATKVATGFVPTINYSITLEPSSTYTFTAATAGYDAQSAKIVTVTNTGNGATGDLIVSLSGNNADSFTLSKTEITSIPVDDGSNTNNNTDTFTVVPKTGLSAGTYTATVSVSGSNIITQIVDVTFTVKEEVHTCALTPVTKQDATCTAAGKEAYYHCNVCGKNYEDAQGQTAIVDLSVWGNIDALSHDWADATCTDPKTCKRDNCGVTEGEALGHTASAWKYDTDNHWKECTVEGCGVKLDSAAHEFEWKIDKDAAETENGSKHEECKICGYKKDAVEIPATGVVTDQEEDVAGEIPEPAETSESTETPTITQPPQTGDNSVGRLWIALMFISSVGAVATTAIRRKF